MINVHSNLIREELANMGVDAFAVLMCITSHINKRKTAWPGIERLRKMTGLSKERTYKAIARLIELGHINRKQVNDKGNFGRTVYRLTTKYLSVFVGVSEFDMEAASDEPYAGNPEHGYPEHGNPESGNPAHLSIDKSGSIDNREVLKNGKSAPSQISQPKDNPIPVITSQAAPDWMDVARQMLEYSRGEGATQYKFICESMRFTGDPMPVFTAWASKAMPYELKNWKAEFRKLGTWFRNEATRGQAYKPVSNATPSAGVGISLNDYKPKV